MFNTFKVDSKSTLQQLFEVKFLVFLFQISEDGLLIKTMTTEEAGEVFTKPVTAVMVTQSSSSTATPTFTAKRIVLPKMVSMDELL